MLPDFFYIGAQKAGTVWLSRNLSQHPDVWLPPSSSVRYLDDPSFWPDPFRGVRRKLKKRTLGLLISKYSRQIKRIVKNGEVGWHLRYTCLPRTDEWYSSLFIPGPGQISGEIVEHYATLEAAQVERVQNLIPGLKIIYVLRDPIDRSWSHVRMRLHKLGKDISLTPDGQLISLFKEKTIYDSSDYLGNLDRWGEFFPRSQIHIAFFEELVGSPVTFFQGICQFLEIDSAPERFPASLKQKFNVGHPVPVPQSVGHWLADTYLPQIEQIHGQFGNEYTKIWLNNARHQLEGSKVS